MLTPTTIPVTFPLQNETDEKKVAHCLVLAQRGLSDLEAYLPKGDGSDNISVTLKGATH